MIESSGRVNRRVYMDNRVGCNIVQVDVNKSLGDDPQQHNARVCERGGVKRCGQWCAGERMRVCGRGYNRGSVRVHQNL